MDWSQVLMAVLIVSAGLTGRQWAVVGIIAANFAVTMELAANPTNVAIADAMAATALIFLWLCGRVHGQRWQVVAGIYAVMIPIYPILSASGFPKYTIYAIIDVLAIAQLFIAGRWDVGVGRALRSVRGRLSNLRRSRAARPELAGRMGVSQAKDKRS